MDEQSLALSFGDSLTEEVSGIAGEYVELGLDALSEDGLFKELPFISSVVSVYRIGKSIRERHHVAKLISFLNEINKGITDEGKRQKYRAKFTSNEKFRNQELEYILILIDRYISFDKPQMLAKLYLAYLDETIAWNEFTIYAELVDRFLPGDKEYFLGRDSLFRIICPIPVPIPASLARLASFGLYEELESRMTKPSTSSTGMPCMILPLPEYEKTYTMTELGEKLYTILSDNKDEE